MTTRTSAVVLRDVRLFAHHGVLPQERLVGAYFLVRLSVETDFTRAADEDCLEGTISYADLFDTVRTEMDVPSALLEHVAARICRAVLQRFPAARAVRIELLKENPPMGAECAGAGVVLEATR